MKVPNTKKLNQIVHKHCFLGMLGSSSKFLSDQLNFHKTGLHTNFFSWWPSRATKIINYWFLVARIGNLVARKKKWEMNGCNIRLHMMLIINAGCLSLASRNEWRYHSSLYNAKNKCWVLSLAWEMNDGNYICLRMTLEIIIGSLSFMLEMKWFHLALFAAKKIESCL